jgi:superfamily II DNA or RNA helicase
MRTFEIPDVAMELAEPDLPPAMQERFDRVVEIYEQIRQETGEDYSFQLPSIKRLCIAVDRFNGALDASDTGTGKTAVACAVAFILGLRLFVVCPKVIITPWRRMAALFQVECHCMNYEMLRTGRTVFGRWHERVSARGKPYKVFQFRWLNPVDRLFVFDECHRMKDYRTLNCQVGVAAIESKFKVLALSATAADNPMHMKFVSYLTRLVDHPSQFFGWMMTHGVRRGRFGLEFMGGRNVLSKIHRQIFPLHGSRIRIADLGDMFPQTQIISEPYEMESAEEIEAIYREMHKALEELREAAADDKGACVLTELLRARQKVELLKVPTFVQMAKDGLDEGMSVVVVVNFDQTVTEVCRKLRTTNTITGAVKQDQRQDLIDRFNADHENLIVLNIKAGGLGISLHGKSTGRPRLVLISPTFSGIDLKQALGRCHRAGGAHSIQKIVWCAGTVEERACDKVRKRLQRVSIFNDDKLDESLAI